MTASGRALLVRLTLICLGVRVLLEVIGLISLAVHHQPLSHGLTMWNQWDAPHYLRIAEVGYKRGTPPPDDPLFIVFFPFFPLAAAIVGFVVRNLVLAGLIVSFAATVGALYFLYRLVAIEGDDSRARRTLVLLLAFPTAYFLAAPYTEALFLFAVVACMYAARRGAWARAGLAGALATGTRVTGIALLPALALEALRDKANVATQVKRSVWIATTGAGLAIYLAINQIVYHDAFWFLKVQRDHWYQYAIWPWQSIIDAIHALGGAQHGDATFIYRGRLIGFAFAVPLLVVAIRKLRASDTVYGWTGFILILSASWLISLPRYILVLYPLFIVGADLTKSRRVYYPVVLVFVLLQVWLFSRYAIGRWTF